MKKIGALEAGGTKMVLGVFDEAGQELERLTIPTEAPEVTMPRMTGFFRDHAIDALGVGSFGPLDLDPRSPTYGNITSTPKLKWRNYPLLRGLLDGRDIPAAIDTDVNAAVIAEVEQGAARGCESAVYITIGTGVGGGIMGVVPGVMGVAAFAPPLDGAGNSVKAQKALAFIAGHLNLNVFGTTRCVMAGKEPVKA